ncbi:MAG: hypothetical protein WA005_10875 [Candidatus Binataceae bacterium]
MAMLLRRLPILYHCAPPFGHRAGSDKGAVSPALIFWSENA